MDRLDGRVAMVTGAASGIGKAVAKRLADEGAAVVVTDIQAEAGEATVAELKAQGARAIFIRHDVTSGGFGVSPAYHAAKGAVRTLTKNVALHWATEGVRVNSIHPGFIATPILEQSRNTPIWDGMIDLTPMGRLGRPEEIAAGVAYLASDDASFVTGLELYVDGGYLAR